MLSLLQTEEKMPSFIRYLIRIFLWALRSLWRSYPKPTRKLKLFSRSYMRKAWQGRLRDLDREVNSKSLNGNERLPRDRWLLNTRRIMIAKRRLYRFD